MLKKHLRIVQSIHSDYRFKSANEGDLQGQGVDPEGLALSYSGVCLGLPYLLDTFFVAMTIELGVFGLQEIWKVWDVD